LHTQPYFWHRNHVKITFAAGESLFFSFLVLLFKDASNFGFYMMKALFIHSKTLLVIKVEDIHSLFLLYSNHQEIFPRGKCKLSVAL